MRRPHGLQTLLLEPLTDCAHWFCHLLLQSNPQITRVKLFNADPVALTALANLGPTVEVMIMVPNQKLQSIAVDDSAADGWVYDNLLVLLPTGVNIK